MKLHKKEKADNKEKSDGIETVPTEQENAEQQDAQTDNETGSADSPEAAPDTVPGQQYNELLDKYQRNLAEFDNFRKRTAKEKAAMYDEGLRETVEKLLPVIDNFERALNAGDDKEDKFYQGVSMIARQIGGFLTELGVEQISAAPGDSFNPNLHFAVAHMEDAELGANVIVDELQKGYIQKEKVIRPSMVRVAN